jgi:hypothetical protein
VIAITVLSVAVVIQAYYIQAADAQTKLLPNNSVTSEKIKNSEVKSADIEDGTITSTDIASGAIQPHTYIKTGGGSIAPRYGVPFAADCEEGDIATGGGFATSAGNPFVKVTHGQPLDSNTWIVAGYSENPFTDSLTVFAVCLEPSP